MTTVEDLRAAAAAVFAAHAGDFGLDPASVDVRYLLNRGGFVNHSFRVSDRRTHLHVKLAPTAEGRDRLARWRDLDAALRRHRAPPVLGWVEVGGAEGLVFPALPGGVPPFGEDVVRAVAEGAAALWTDEALGERLGAATPITAGDAYLATYHDRFVADLAGIAAAPPPFFRGATLEYLWAEVDAMERRVRSSAAFQEALTTPVHGDLWFDNVLWDGPGSWWLLDWDDLHIGDPALDLVMLTGPTPGDLRPLKMPELAEAWLPPAAWARVETLGQASLLDWVIDPMSDWIEAVAAPDRTAEVRAEKERVHRSALALYRTTYPD